MTKKPQIILVSGFLGSGKTTLMNRLIKFYSSKKIGVVVNDFGNLSIDKILIKKVINSSGFTNIQMHEISNGSIFCSCLSNYFVKTLKIILLENPEYIIIETSGLSNPESFRKLLVDNNLHELLEVKYKFCLIDPIKTMKLSKNLTSIIQQIIHSNYLLINKIDLVNNDEINNIYEFLKKINCKAKILKSIYSDIKFELLEENIEQEIPNTVIHYEDTNQNLDKIILEQKDITFDQLKNYYSNFKIKILRIKGFLIIEKNYFFISDSNDELHIEICTSKIEKLGLSVLVFSKNTELIKTNWEKLNYKETENE